MEQARAGGRTQRRDRELREAAAFLTGRRIRPRALAVRGEPGIGKTTFLDLLQVELLALGDGAVVVVDDADSIDAADVDRIRREIGGGRQVALVVAAVEVPRPLMRMLTSCCEHRVLDLWPMSDDEARWLLADLGVQPWTLRASRLLATAAGNARRLVEGAVADAGAGSPQEDAGWTQAVGEQARLRGDATHGMGPLHARLLHVLQVQAAAPELPPHDQAQALALLAWSELEDGNLEAAVVRAQLAAASDDASLLVQLSAALVVASAGARRGDHLGLLSLHAVAGRAARAGLVEVEAQAWHEVSRCAIHRGDVQEARRAATCSLQLADAHGALDVALAARAVLASTYLHEGDLLAADAYLEEVATIARLQAWARLHAEALVDRAGIALQRGKPARAAELVEQARHVVGRGDLRRPWTVDLAVAVARLDARCMEAWRGRGPHAGEATPAAGTAAAWGRTTVAAQREPAGLELLTRREREVARYVAGGLTNAEVAAELHLSQRTVEHHVSSILRKLELPGRRALVRGYA